MPTIASFVMGNCSRDFRTEQEYLGRVKPPKQHQDQGPGSAVARARSGRPELPANQGLAEGKKNGSEKRTHRDLSPTQWRIGQHLVNRAKQNRKKCKR